VINLGDIDFSSSFYFKILLLSSISAIFGQVPSLIIDKIFSIKLLLLFFFIVSLHHLFHNILFRDGTRRVGSFFSPDNLLSSYIFNPKISSSRWWEFFNNYSYLELFA